MITAANFREEGTLTTNILATAGDANVIELKLIASTDAI